MLLLTMMPVGAKRDSAPACAPLPTISAIRNGGIAARVATAIAIGAMIAVVAMLPGPMLDSVTRDEEEHDRDHAGVAAAGAHRPRRDAAERAVVVGHAEQQRDADEIEQQIDRKGADHLRERHAAQVDADDPRQGQRHHADVDARHHAQRDGDDQRGQRNPGKVHRGLLVKQRPQQYGGMHRRDAGEIGDLVAAGGARRDEHRSRRHAPAPPAAAYARRSRATRRSDRACSRTIRPCRSSRRRDRRPSPTGIRDSSALAGAASPIDRWWQCGWSRTFAGPGLQRQRGAARRAFALRGTPRTAPTAAPPLARGAAARRAADPAHLREPPTGSSAPRTRSPGRARPRRRAHATFAAASRRASDRRPCEISGRPQQTFGATLVAMPAAFITSIAARPISGSA